MLRQKLRYELEKLMAESIVKNGNFALSSHYVNKNQINIDGCFIQDLLLNQVRRGRKCQKAESFKKIFLSLFLLIHYEIDIVS